MADFGGTQDFRCWRRGNEERKKKRKRERERVHHRRWFRYGDLDPRSNTTSPFTQAPLSRALSRTSTRLHSTAVRRSRPARRRRAAPDIRTFKISLSHDHRWRYLAT